MLALRLVDALGLQHAQCFDQLRAGLARLNYVVDIAALRRRVGVGEVGFVVVDQFLAALVGGLPILAGAVTLHAAAPAPQRMGPLRPRRGCRLVARLLGRIAALYVLRALP